MEHMEIAVMESHLIRAVSCLESDQAGSKLSEVLAELRCCEQALVAKRFVRSNRADGSSVRVRVPAVDAALIHVSRALSLVGADRMQLDLALESIEHARTEVAHISS
jgi:hypothetical protein